MDDFKIGDIVYCYNDHIYRENLYSRKGEYYKIANIIIHDDDSIAIGLHHNDNMSYVTYYCILNSYNQYDYVQNYNLDMFYDYFMTLNQYRNLKLEKLNGRI